MSKKLDPRVIRTRKLLRDALIELILEQGYETITIQDITDRATLNHATFYLHYSNKEELLNVTLDSMFDELAQAIPPPSQDNLSDVSIPMRISTRLFHHFGDNATFYRVILGSKGVTGFNTRLREYLATAMFQRFSILQTEQDRTASMQFAAEFVASAYVGMIIWWLENDQPMSPDDLAKQFITIAVAGVFPYIGVALSDAMPTPQTDETTQQQGTRGSSHST